MIPGSANPLLLASAAAAGAGYEIERSLRFNSSDSAYLSRTPASAGNRKTWTWAGWVKRSALSSRQNIFSGGTSTASASSLFYFGFWDGNEIRFSSGTAQLAITTPIYRDPSAWYHIVVTVDTTQATANNRIKLYVNGVQVNLSVTSLNQNDDTAVNSTSAHSIGRYFGGYYLDGYLADIHFIDGQALTPSSFGYFDANNVWQPIAYTGSYGTNGFHLPFGDNSTAAALGTDTSGNSNTWTVNNISVAAGAGNDSLVDSPTDYGEDTGAGGEVRGNYATWNPLYQSANSFYSDGNLKFTPNTGYREAAATTLHVGFKAYVEITLVTTGPYTRVGLLRTTTDPKLGSTAGYNSPIGAGGWATGSFGYEASTGICWVDAVNTYSAAAYTGGDTIGIAYDPATGNVYLWKNGVAQNSGAAVATLDNDYKYQFAITEANTYASILNTGQRPFAYTVPSGYKALCTANLPSETITTSGSYTGNGVADGPFVYLNGVPTAMTVVGNAVTFGTHADKLSNGFKIRTTSTTYNQNAVIYDYSITSTGDPFTRARAQAN